ncbi:tetratricopeptide (TPR) repeat protein [Elusimicrobium simillimum]|uniref:tetratricopeptide repeat protein n=1 Tax=Elusimicrobium simillimum TaxID=3143438 RepID=UPI003C700E69
MIKRLIVILLVLCVTPVAFGQRTSKAKQAQSAFTQARKETDLNKAVKLYNKAIELNPKYAAAYHYRGDANKDLGRLQSAVKDYSSAIKYDDKDAFKYYSRAIAYTEQKKYSSAIEDLTKAISLKSNFLDFYLKRADLYYKQDKFDLAVKDYEKFGVRKKKDNDYYLKLGVSYIGIYKYDKANAQLDKFLELEPNRPEGYFYKGRILFNQGNHDVAISYFSKAVNRDVSYQPAYRLRASAFKEINDYEYAIKDYTKLIELNPDPLYYNRRGLVYEEMGNLKAAEEDYSKTIELNPKWAIGYNNRGYVNLKLKKWTQAKEDFETAIKLDPTQQFPYVNLAGYYWLHKKDKKNTLNNLDQALRRNFKDTEALYDDSKKGWMFKNINTTAEFRALIYR